MQLTIDARQEDKVMMYGIKDLQYSVERNV